MRDLKTDEKIALWVFGAVCVPYAVEKWYKHPTLGNGIQAFIATLSFAI